MKKIIRNMKCSIALSLIFIILFIVDILANGFLIEWGSLTTATVFSSKQLWRLVTAAFLHSGVLHLFFNVGGILLIGYTVEKNHGMGRFALVYFIAMICGALMQCLVPSINGVQLTGASGEIFALLGVSVMIFANEPQKIINEFKSLFGIMRLILIFIYFCSSFINGLTLLAHLFGMCIGIIYMITCIIITNVKKRNAPQDN